MKQVSQSQSFGAKVSFAFTFALLFAFCWSTNAQSITLAWDANTETDLAGYNIKVGNQSGVYPTTINVGNVIAYTVPDLVPGVLYYFAVTAYNQANQESRPSNEVTGTIPTAPKPPTSLKITKLTAAVDPTEPKVKVSWETNLPTKGRIRYGKTPTTMNELKTTGTNYLLANKLTIIDLKPRTKYFYIVTAQPKFGVPIATSGTFKTNP